jgi:alkylation response protein AidB-like acyl-CoA dehydrogenase
LSTLRAAADHDLTSFMLPASLGGRGRGWEDWGALLHEVSYLCADAGFPALLSSATAMQQLLARAPHGTAAGHYARTIASGDAFLAFCWTEGTDPFSFATTARRDGSDFVLSGRKKPLVGAQIATAFVIFARDTRTGDVVAAIVDREDRGVTVTPMRAIGLRSTGFGSVQLDEVRVPDERVLAVADGVSFGQVYLNVMRLQIPIWLLGRMRQFFERCVIELRERIRYDAPVTEMQAVQAAFGSMAVSLETTRLVVRDALARAGQCRHESYWDPGFAVAKYHAVEQALALGRTAQGILGGAAVFEADGFERELRGFQCLVANVGTQLVLQIDLGALVVAETRQPQEDFVHDVRPIG